MSKQATIPDFADGDVRGMATALRAMKQQLEVLTGQKRGPSKGAPSVYVQALEPTQSTLVVFKEGDLWINPEIKNLWFHNGSYWVKLL